MPVKNALILTVSLVLILSVAACSGKPVSSTAATSATDTSLPVGALSTITYTTDAPVDTVIPIYVSGTQTPATGNVPTILIGLDGGFNPLTMTVAEGTTVNLENDDCCNPHTVNSSYPFAQTVDPGLTGSVTFGKTGRYTLWIDNDQSVIGTITVD